MKAVGIIPARGGSKGILKKNIKLLRGKPLIQYTIEAALASKISRVIVSTDDEEIASVAKKCGAEVLMRPVELAQDHTPTLPVLQDVVARLNEAFDFVLTLQPTSPLRTSSHINEALELIYGDDSADSLVSVVKVPHNCSPSSIMEMQGNYVLPVEKEKIILRRQEKPIFWARNGAAIYITRMSRLAEYIWGGKTLPYEMGKIESLDIDDMEDWQIIESIIECRK